MIGQNRLENDFHWLFTTVVYQQIENSERANQIHRFTIDHSKFILKLDRNTENIFYFLISILELWLYDRTVIIVLSQDTLRHCSSIVFYIL